MLHQRRSAELVDDLRHGDELEGTMSYHFRILGLALLDLGAEVERTVLWSFDDRWVR